MDREIMEVTINPAMLRKRVERIEGNLWTNAKKIKTY
jgi:hypothetical protein